MDGSRVVLVVFALFAFAGTAPANATQRRSQPAPRPSFEVRSLDGGGNNTAHPDWGRVGEPYQRYAPSHYPDGVAQQSAGPDPRYVSNRIFNDVAQNIFSERHVSQWVWTWGQFMDHTFGLAEGGGEDSPIPFNAADPLESFRNDLGMIPFARDAAAPATGTSPRRPRQQINTVSSYIDGWSVYGGTRQRLEWLREGPFDGDMTNNGPHLLTAPRGYLPRATGRGNPSAAPNMAINGQLTGHPQDAAVAGDVRANENMALTAVHTLFVREHNRIVDSLPSRLPAEEKFQIARRIVGAEQQFITYNEFLPALGVRLSPYIGYRRRVDATLGNEFATVAYRAHSMIHGEFEIAADRSDYTPERLDALESKGIEVEDGGAGEIEFVVPLGVAYFNPDLVGGIGLGPILAGLGDESQYNNDEQIDNALRSVLFQFPGPDAPDPGACFSDPSLDGCYQAVVDLGAIDIQRARDHGMPTYNQLRRAFGLLPKQAFTSITREPTERFHYDPEVDYENPIDDPDILDFVDLRDAEGNPIPFGSDAAHEGAVNGTRRTTLAARLKAIYGSVDDLDAFVGMMAEAHMQDSEFGSLQRTIWRRQFQALRDGDRFFYLNDPVLDDIRRKYGIGYRHRLSELIALDTNLSRSDVARNVFIAP